MYPGPPRPSAPATGERSPTGESGPDVGSAVVVGNAGDADRPVSVRRRRGGRERTDAVTLAPGETRTLAVPEGDGPASVELHARHAAARTTFEPETVRLPPLFAVRERAVVVLRG